MLESILSWNTLYWLIVIVYVPVCIGLIVIVLLQKGKNMGFAGAFGVNPGGDTVLGPRASRSLPVRMTYIMASAFIVLCIFFALIEGRRQQGVAPDKVDPAELQAQQQINEELSGLGAPMVEGDDEATPPGEMDPAEAAEGESSEPVADAPTIDEAEPAANVGDETEAADATAEIEEMPEEEDTP